MSHYHYFTTDLLTGAVLSDLPLTDVSIDEELNEAGSMSASLNLFATDAPVMDVKAATMPARTAIYVGVDDQILWGGIIWKRRLQGHSLELIASGFLSYFARNLISTTLTFSQVEQFEIARQLIGHAQGKPGGNIGVDVGSGQGSGRLRDRTYDGLDRKPVLEALQEIAAVRDGFDLAIRAEYDAGHVPRKRLQLGYPQIGRGPNNTDLLIEYPGVITSWNWPEEGDRMITTAYVRGELASTDVTTTATAPFAEITDQALLDAGYPRLEEEYPASEGTVNQSTLDERAQAALDTYGHPVTLPTFTIAAGSHHDGPHANDYVVGDHFRVRLTDPEWMPAGPLGQPGFDGTMRLIRRSITINGGDGGEAATLTMNPFPAVF